jgi:DNA-binding LytR/AlgR family response regulator
VIIDDEPLAIRVLSSHIRKTKGLSLVKSFENAFEALYFVQTREVDLIFLDIQMPGVNGIQFIRILKYPPKIIITSAFREYALEALTAGVTDYLLKPVAYERFLTAIGKALETRPPQTTRLPESSGQGVFFFVKDSHAYTRIAEEEVLFLRGDRNYCHLQLPGRSITLTGNLAHFSGQLDQNKFRRIHRSYVVALRHITRFTVDTVWINGEELPVGRTYRRELMNYLNKFKW